MANVMLVKGGPYRYNLSSTARQTVYEGAIRGSAKRIAAEYAHGIFTLGNSFNPMFSIGQAEALKDYAVGVGDVIDLFVVPPCHTLMDVAAKTVPVQFERGYQGEANSDGVVFTVVARILNKDTLKETGQVELVTALDSVVLNTHSFQRSAIKPTDGGYFVSEDECVVVGLKVNALPADKNVKLYDVTGRVEVSSHVLDYEVPMHV